MRKYLLNREVQTILPTTSTFDETFFDKVTRSLNDYATQTEFNIYDQANNQEEYFHLLAEMINKIQKDLEDRRNATKNQVPSGQSYFFTNNNSFLNNLNMDFSSIDQDSSMALLYELYNQNNEKIVYKCNKCGNMLIEMRYHCSVCDDFDLCIPCYEQRGGHEHKMEKLSSSADKKDSNSGESKLASTSANAKPPKHSIETYLKAFMHAVYCRNANCTFLKCMQFKRVVQHSKNCQKFKNSQCEFCKQMIALCIYHAKNCKENMCQVPFCSTIKIKLKQQKAYNTTLERRRMQLMTRTFINAASSNNNTSTKNEESEGGTVSNNESSNIGTSHQQQQQQTQQQQMIQQQQQQNMFNTNNVQFSNNAGGASYSSKEASLSSFDIVNTANFRNIFPNNMNMTDGTNINNLETFSLKQYNKYYV